VSVHLCTVELAVTRPRENTITLRDAGLLQIANCSPSYQTRSAPKARGMIEATKEGVCSLLHGFPIMRVNRMQLGWESETLGLKRSASIGFF
jgi:hypothetical protein